MLLGHCLLFNFRSFCCEGITDQVLEFTSMPTEIDCLNILMSVFKKTLKLICLWTDDGILCAISALIVCFLSEILPKSPSLWLNGIGSRLGWNKL